MTTYFFRVRFEQSTVATYGGKIHDYIFVAVRYEQSTVATYCGIYQLFIIHIRFMFSFVSLTKYAGRKLKTVMWLQMAGKFMTAYFIKYGYLGNVSSIDCR